MNLENMKNEFKNIKKKLYETYENEIRNIISNINNSGVFKLEFKLNLISGHLIEIKYNRTIVFRLFLKENNLLFTEEDILRKVPDTFEYKNTKLNNIIKLELIKLIKIYFDSINFGVELNFNSNEPPMFDTLEPVFIRQISNKTYIDVLFNDTYNKIIFMKNQSIIIFLDKLLNIKREVIDRNKLKIKFTEFISDNLYLEDIQVFIKPEINRKFLQIALRTFDRLKNDFISPETMAHFIKNYNFNNNGYKLTKETQEDIIFINKNNPKNYTLSLTIKNIKNKNSFIFNIK